MIDGAERTGVGRKSIVDCLIFGHNSTGELNGKGKIQYFLLPSW
jgi:hypothetical protein